MKEYPSKRIRKDDNVLVIAGNNRGKTGKVMRVSGEKVFIQGVNVRKKHVRATRIAKGGIVEREMPIHVSNVQICIDGKPVKLRTRYSAKGEKELFYKDGQKRRPTDLFSQKGKFLS